MYIQCCQSASEARGVAEGLWHPFGPGLGAKTRQQCPREAYVSESCFQLQFIRLQTLDWQIQLFGKKSFITTKSILAGLLRSFLARTELQKISLNEHIPCLLVSTLTLQNISFLQPLNTVPCVSHWKAFCWWFCDLKGPSAQGGKWRLVFFHTQRLSGTLCVKRALLRHEFRGCWLWVPCEWTNNLY